ncbi:MAG: SBBP repeat-containing protein, partial [Planctomycetota bacterium]
MSMLSARAHYLDLFEQLEPRLLLDGAVGQEAVELFSASPAVFIENAGQWADEAIRYAHLGSGGNVLHTTAGPVVQLFGAEEDGGAAVSVRFDGAAAVNPAGQDLAGGYYNFYVGDQADWRSGVAGYETVAYEGLYAGVDLLTWGRANGLKYEFRVAPGADPAAIQMTYAGADVLYLKKGDLRIVTPLGELVDDAPVAYQMKPNGKRRNLKATFELVDADTVAFKLRRNALPGLEIVIDPNIAWGSYLGGTGEETGYDVAVDATDNVLVCGRTESAGWVMGGPDTTFNGDEDAFVVKLDTNGGHLWSTFLGGTGYERATGLAADGSGNVFVCGLTQSDSWIAAGWDTTRGGTDGFAVKLASTGTYAWGTYLGGLSWEEAYAVTVDGVGNVIVVGETDSAGWTGGGWDTSHNGDTDGFVVKLSNAGAHVWSSFMGDTGTDEAYDVATDGANNVVIIGYTYPGAGDWVSGGYDTTQNGRSEAFILKATSGGAHTWSTYVGGDEFDYARGV